MANRHALLIGVPRYDDEEFNDERLESAVRSDIAAMRAALLQSDYTITECGIDNADRGGATLSRINRAIEEACASAPAGGVLLIYFSGHGVTVDGTDYLVPSDAYRQVGSDPAVEPVIRGLVPVVPDDDDVLRRCRASLLAFFVDACRDDTSGVQPEAEPGGQQPFLAGGGQFVLVMGCAAGQVCQYDETGSAFTQSLTKVLDARNPARTLSEVMSSVTDDVRRRSRQSQGDPQEPVARNPNVLELAGRTEICDGDELTDAWRKAVGASALLGLCKDEDKDLVRDKVAECAQRCGSATLMLRNRTGLTDLWTDQDYPVRVLKNTEFLLRNAGFLPDPEQARNTGDAQSTEDRRLDPGEIMLLIVAPFLREAVLAVGIKDAASIDPANLDRTYIPGPRSDLELTHEMYPHLVRRARGLRQNGDARSADQIALWLVHRWLTDRVKLWDEAGTHDTCKIGATLIESGCGSMSQHEVLRLVQALLMAIGAEAADEDVLRKLSAAFVSERWRFLAAILWLAGTMAADPRRLPPVVADLIGTRMELRLSEVGFAAGRPAKWSRGADDVLDLTLACEHPALHDAFEDIVRRAAVTSEAVRTRLALSTYSEALPCGLTSNGLRAATIQDNQPAYDVPLSRFQIAEEKVRELLMGRQLYGDPALAIRELYQNALDACRWRATRQQYLERTGQSPAPWSGLIRFTQGADDDGRPYIDCEDNGVGMDIDTLKHVFANAGERFVYGQEFRAEQAVWADLDPPLRMVSNSQFGIGVFSYFMLADEITVLTRHQLRDGAVASQAHEVRIASSGSLFQIRPAGGLSGGGTRIRLYLSGEAGETSVLSTLRDLLWVAEHQVDAVGPDGRESWSAGDLRYPSLGADPLKCGDDMWWVPGAGGLAADGIKTDIESFGTVVNLRSEHRPQFTVDRKSLSTWDEDWEFSLITAALPNLMSWPGFTLPWLWSLAESDINRAQEVYEHAIAIDQYITVARIRGKSAPVVLGNVGCAISDRYILDHVHSSMGMSRGLRRWRIAVWRKEGHAIDRFPESSIPDCVDGFPVPDPIDGSLLGRVSEEYPPHSDDLRPGAIIEAAWESQRTLNEMLRRLRKYAIVGFDLAKIRDLAGLPEEFNSLDDSLFAIFMALEPWELSGEMQARNVVRALAGAANRLELPFGDVAGRALAIIEQLFDIAPDVKRISVDAFSVVDRIEDLLDLNTVRTWLRGEIRPSDLAAASQRLSWPIHRVAELCDDLAPLGITVPYGADYPTDLSEIEIAALELIYKAGQSLSPRDVVRIAHKVGEPIKVVLNALSRLEKLGLLARPELAGPVDFIPGEGEIAILSNQGMSISRAAMQRIGLRASGIYMDTRVPWARVIEIITLRQGSDEGLLAAAHNLIPFTAPDGPITFPQLIDLAYRLRTTLSGAAAALRETYPSAIMPALDPDQASLTIPWIVHRILIDNTSGIIAWRSVLPPIIDESAAANRPLGDLLRSLDPFRQFGAPAPYCSEKTREMLNNVKIDEYDLDMLRVRQGSDAMEVVSSLALVQAAGKMGWTLAQADWRFTRLAPVGLTIGYPRLEFPDEIVYWYDLLALTEYFDGQEPSISGQIDWPHLEKAALEIFGCSPEEVPMKASFLRDRLRIYAALFELELPEDTADA